MSTRKYKQLSSFCLYIALIGTIAHAEQYAVRAGDTLYSIARKFDVTVEDIITLNKITNPTSISIGSRVSIPTGIAPIKPHSSYTIKEGDTLYSIARATGVSVRQLRSANGSIEPSTLSIGRTLSIPPVDTSNKSGGVSAARERSGTLQFSEPEQVVAKTAETTSGNTWPHNGTRNKIGGKFPAIAIDAQAGDIVRSVSSGRVIYTGNSAIFGKVVFVQNGTGRVYIYGGTANTSMKRGDRVDLGTVIGRVSPSTTPLTDGNSPKVYFSVWHNNTFVDPYIAPRG